MDVGYGLSVKEQSMKDKIVVIPRVLTENCKLTTENY